MKISDTKLGVGSGAKDKSQNFGVISIEMIFDVLFLFPAKSINT